MNATSGVQIVAVAFANLAPDEQEAAFARVSAIRMMRLAGQQAEGASLIRSLKLAAERVSGDLTPDAYRGAQRELIADGEEIADFNAVVRFFGSWRLAKEALGLSETTTAVKIEARFRARIVGRARTFRDEELQEELRRCARDLGRPPLMAEYDDWRQRELALAKARPPIEGIGG